MTKLVHGLKIAYLHVCEDCFYMQSVICFHPMQHAKCPLNRIYNESLTPRTTPGHVLYMSAMQLQKEKKGEGPAVAAAVNANMSAAENANVAARK
jgi:hypothetical protein